MDNLPPFFYGGGYNSPLWLSSFQKKLKRCPKLNLGHLLKLATFNV
nr:MAG TPA: hypothetical protein [Caudoviricetes sp.]